FVHRRLSSKNSIPHVSLFQQIDAQIVKVDLEDLYPQLGVEFGFDALLRARDVKRQGRVIVIDEVGNLVAQALHLEESIAAKDLEEVSLLVGQRGLRLQWHQTVLVGKKRMSLGERSVRHSATRADKSTGSMAPFGLRRPASTIILKTTCRSFL